MPWVTPTLDALRALNKSNVQSQLHSAPMIPNSVLRVMSDSNAGLAYLTLLYINWLALQLFPDTAEDEWLDRFADIWLTQGRKTATFGSGVIQFAGIGGVTMPAGTILQGASDLATGTQITFTTQSAVLIGTINTNVPIKATTPGATGLVVGSQLALATGISGINGSGTISSITDGIDAETDDELRVRVLDRIRQPPVGGDANDYIAWALATPGVNVTRAWTSPLELGPGTVTVRIMTDDLINEIVGFASTADLATVTAYIDTVRPVAVRDRFIVTCVPEPIDFTISNLSPDSVAMRNAINASVNKDRK